MSKILGVHYNPAKKIGFDSFASLNFNAGANHIQATRTYCGANTSVSKIGLWLSPIAVAAGIKIVVAIYDDSSGSPNQKLAQSGQYITVGNEGGRMVVINLQSSASLVAGQSYHLCLHTDTTLTIERPHSFTTGSTYGAVYKDLGAYTITLPTSFGSPTGAAGGFMAISAF